MSRDYRDKRGGHSHQYYINNDGVSKFKKQCRKSARMKAKQALNRGEEPEPRYPIESEYFD